MIVWRRGRQWTWTYHDKNLGALAGPPEGQRWSPGRKQALSAAMLVLGADRFVGPWQPVRRRGSFWEPVDRPVDAAPYCDLAIAVRR